MNFSILLSVYNQEKPKYLERCLQSLINQTLKGNEVILVEDGLITSDLSEIIEKYRTQLNIISVQLQENNGLANALNIGLEKCSYNWVARIDSDDIALSNRFKKQI